MNDQQELKDHLVCSGDELEFKYVRRSCLICESVSVRSALNPNWTKWQWHCDDCGSVCDHLKEEVDAMNEKNKCKCGGVLLETTTWSSKDKTAQCGQCCAKYVASDSDMLADDFEWLLVTEQPKDYVEMDEFKCDNCGCDNTYSKKTGRTGETKHGCRDCDFHWFTFDPSVEESKQPTPIVEVHYEYCHGIYVVLALIIGGLIGFIFGVTK